MGTKLDFKVKKGIDVEGGDITVASGNVVYAPTFDTNVAAAGVTLSGTTLQADGTDTNINIAITPKGSGEVDITKVDIDGGTIDGTTINTSDITVGSGKTLDVSAGTLTLADDQISGDKISGGTIGTTTITALAGDLSLGDNNITNVGSLYADSISADDVNLGLTIDMSDGPTQSNKIILKDNLADALNITESTNPYMKFRTVDTEERIEIFRDIEFSDARNHVFDVESQSTANTAGKNLTIGAGEGTGTQDGGQLIFESAGSGGATGATPTIRATAMTIFPSGTVQIPYVDINDGTIDGALIGSTTADAATFTNVTVEKGGWARINGDARETNSKLQVNGDAFPGTPLSGNTTLDYVEARLHTDIANDDINGTATPYAGLTNTFILDNDENASATHQSVVFSIGNGASNGEHWAIGRKGGGTFSIGYKNTNFDDDPENNAAIFDAQTIFDLDTSGNASLSKTGATLEFNGNATYTTKIKASASTDASVTYTLPINAGSSGYVLQTDGSGTLSWVVASSGADGMGAGFDISDGSTTDTITTSETVTFGGTGVDATVSSGAVNYSLDLNELSAAVVDVAADSIAIIDADDNSTKKESIADLATGMAGDGLTATSGVFTVNADQSSIITAVGNLTSLTTASLASVDINGADVDITATTLSIDSTDTTNLTMTANNAGDKTLTIDAANTGAGAADIKIGTTSGTAVTIGHSTSEVTIGQNLTVTGNLTVDGTTTTVNSTTLQVDDKNIELGTVASPSDTTADGGGITLKGTTDHTITWDNTNDNWTSSEHWNLVTGKVFKINNTSVLSATTLGSGVTTSSLTTVGILNSGSITSGFGTINTGSSAISTTGTLTGGSIVGTSLDVSGNIEGTGTLSLNNGSNTITATELNVLDGVTAGTVTASKALVVDANKDIGDLRNLTATGALEADGLQLTGGANSAADSATVVAIMDVSEATNQSWTASTAYTIANYAFGTYRTAKFIVQVSDGIDTDCMEVLVTYEGASAPTDSTNIFLTTYAYITTAASDLGTIDAVKGTTTIDLQFTPASTGTYSYSVVNTLLIK